MLSNLNINYMKAISLMIVLSVLIFSCSENPVNSTKNKTDKIPADTLFFEIHQNYGYCDTSGCYTYDTLLLSGIAINDRGYGYSFTTFNDSVWGYNQWLKYTNCYFIYQTTGAYYFNCFLDDGTEFYAGGNNYEILYLNHNTTYNIGIQ